jgi:heavy metal translocating P-type ATPase
MSCCPAEQGRSHAAAGPRPEPAWWRIGVAIALAGQSMLVSLTVNVGEMHDNVRLFFHIALAAVTVLVFELVGSPLARAVRGAWAQRTLRFELLFASGIAGALGVSVFGMIRGGDVYFEVAAILCVLFALGHRLNAEGRRRSLDAVRQLGAEQSRAEVRTCCGSTRSVPMEEVAPGDHVVVHPGRRIPFDGVVHGGAAFVRQAALTGEPFAVVRRAGDPVHAGSHVLDATLEVRVTHALGARAVDRVARCIEQAWNAPCRLERLADRLTRWFLPLVAAVAGIVFVAWGVGADWRTGALHAMSVLLVACPCAMGFATPLAVWNATSRLGRQGLVLRGGDTLERLAQVDTVALDKTGTLTRGDPHLLDLVVSDRAPFDREVMQRLLAVVQRGSDHPLSEAFRRLDPEQQGDERFALQSLENRPGRGLEAQVDDRQRGATFTVFIGVAPAGDRACDHGIVPRLRSELRAPAGTHAIGIRIDGELVALAAVDEQDQVGAHESLQALRDMGLDLVVLTGDRDRRRAERFAPLARVRAGLSPEAKQREIDALLGQGRRVLYVGDGINDGAAMAKSHATLAPHTAAAVSREMADGVWHTETLTTLVDGLATARSATRTVQSNLRFAAAYNGVAMGVAAAGLLHPVFAATLMVGSSLWVTWRAGRTVGASPLQDPACTPPAAAVDEPAHSNTLTSAVPD